MNLEEAWQEYREAKAAMEVAWRRYEELRFQTERRIRIPTGGVVAQKRPRQKREKQPRQPISEWHIEDHIAS